MLDARRERNSCGKYICRAVIGPPLVSVGMIESTARRMATVCEEEAKDQWGNVQGESLEGLMKPHIRCL